MAPEADRARQIARRVPAVEWDVLELAAEVPWLEAGFNTASVDEVAAWARRALTNAAGEPISAPVE